MRYSSRVYQKNESRLHLVPTCHSIETRGVIEKFNVAEIKRIESRIEHLKGTYNALFPIWNVTDRKIKMIKAEIDKLEEKRALLNQGQLNFDEPDF